MKKLACIYIVLSAVTTSYAQSEFIERDNKVDTLSPIDLKTLQNNLAKKRQLLEIEKFKEQQIHSYTAEELINNPIDLEKLLVSALIRQDLNMLDILVQIYAFVPNKDDSLIDWANAILQRKIDLGLATDSYRNLISIFPTNNFLRFQFAETLFYNQDYYAAKKQFKKLSKLEGILQSDSIVFNNYLDAIQRQENWNFSFGATFLNDRNLTNIAKPGTRLATANGVLTTQEREKGRGFSSWVGTNKQWYLDRGRFVNFNSNISGKYYWNNQSFNEMNAYAGLGFGYSNANLSVIMTPNIEKRWYSGGVDASSALKKYSNTYGISFALDYWLNSSFKYSAGYSLSHDIHYKDQHILYDGTTKTITNSLLYFPNTEQFVSFSADLLEKNTQNKFNSYKRVALHINWGQEWLFGFNTSASIGVANRIYKEKSFLGFLQDNIEHSIRISLSNKNIQYKGFIPKLTWNYSTIDSTIPIYSYSKNNVMLEIGRSF